MSTTPQLGQVEMFVDRTREIPAPQLRPIQTQGGPDTDATVPFQTALELTGSQEERLVAHCMLELKRLEDESGRTQVLTPSWWTSRDFEPDKHADLWMVKRARFEAMFQNNLAWRPRAKGGIFLESNLTLPVSRRITRQTIARANNYYFGSSPWFAAKAEGIEDQALAQTIEKYATWKLDKLGSKRAKQLIIRHACVRGEAIVKTVHTTRSQIYDTFLKVLADAENKPIMAQDGDFITEADQWAEATEGPSAGQVVLARDGATPKPPVPNWTRVKAKREQVLFHGPESKAIYYRDFLAPMDASDLQTASTIIHLYDKPVHEIVQQFVKNGTVSQEVVDAAKNAPDEAHAPTEEDGSQAEQPTGDTETPDEALRRTRKAVDLIRALAANTTAPKSAANRAPRASDQEDSDGADQWRTKTDQLEPIAEIAEVYTWFDVDGDGIQENLMVLIDRASQRPIYYDHVANLTTDGRRPFDVVRINDVDDRWYGQGVMELFDTHQDVIDLNVNRWSVTQGGAGRVDFWSPHLTVEGTNDPDLKMNYGGSYTPKPGADPDKILKSVYLNDVKFDKLERIFELFTQAAMNESGVQHVNDAETAGLDTAKLATGIRNMEAAGQELFAPVIADLESGLQATLNREIAALFAHLDHAETFRYLEGKNTVIATITPDQVAGLDLDVTMKLTRYKNEQKLKENAQASTIIREYYSLPPEVQERVVEVYREMLRTLDLTIDVEQAIAPLPPLMIDPTTGQPMSQPGQAMPQGRPSAPPVRQPSQPDGFPGAPAKPAQDGGAAT